MLLSGMFDEAIAQLCSLEGVCAYADCDGLSVMAHQLCVLMAKLPLCDRVRDFYHWISREQRVIVESPRRNVITSSW
jgi:hypothetical protein